MYIKIGLIKSIMKNPYDYGVVKGHSLKFIFKHDLKVRLNYLIIEIY